MKPRTLICSVLLAASASLAAPALAQAHEAQPAHTAPAAAHDAADAAHEAAGHGEHDKAGVLPTVAQGLMPSIVNLVVFVVVLGVLSAKVWPKINAGLKDRENKIREEIEAAEMARQQAKDALEQYQKSLADARIEAQKMLEQARTQQLALAADLKAKSDKELSELRDRARKDIESAKRTAVAEIYNEAANLGTTIASKILQRQVNAGDTQKLVEESVRQMSTLRN